MSLLWCWLDEARSGEANGHGVTPLGDRIERTEFRPVAIAFRSGGAKRNQESSTPSDLAVIERCASLPLLGAPNVELPYLHMTHERSTIFA